MHTHRLSPSASSTRVRPELSYSFQSSARSQGNRIWTEYVACSAQNRPPDAASDLQTGSSGRFRRSAARNRPLPTAVWPSQRIGNPKRDCPGQIPVHLLQIVPSLLGKLPENRRFRYVVASTRDSLGDLGDRHLGRQQAQEQQIDPVARARQRGIRCAQPRPLNVVSKAKLPPLRTCLPIRYNYSLPARTAARFGRKGLSSAAMGSVLTKTGQFASFGRNSKAKVVLPARSFRR